MNPTDIKNMFVAMDKCGYLEKTIKVDSLTLEQLLVTYDHEEEKVRIIKLLIANNMLLKCTYNNLLNIMSMFPNSHYTTVKLLEPFIDTIDKNTFMMLLKLDIFPASLDGKRYSKNDMILCLFDKIIDIDEILVSQIYPEIGGFDARKEFLNKVVTKFKTITHLFLFSLLNYEAQICSCDEIKIKIMKMFHQKLETIDEYNCINILDTFYNDKFKGEAFEMLLPMFTLGFILNCAIEWSEDMKYNVVVTMINKNIINCVNVIDILKWCDDDIKIKVLRLFIAKGFVSKRAHTEILNIIPQCKRNAVSAVLNNIKYDQSQSDIDYIVKDVLKIIIKFTSQKYIYNIITTTQGTLEATFLRIDDVKNVLHKYLPDDHYKKQLIRPSSKYVMHYDDKIVINFEYFTPLVDKYDAICNAIDMINLL